jgi:hypothetical protein
MAVVGSEGRQAGWGTKGGRKEEKGGGGKNKHQGRGDGVERTEERGGGGGTYKVCSSRADAARKFLEEAFHI